MNSELRLGTKVNTSDLCDLTEFSGQVGTVTELKVTTKYPYRVQFKDVNCIFKRKELVLAIPKPKRNSL